MNEEPDRDGPGGGNTERESFERRLAEASRRATPETLMQSQNNRADASGLNLAMRLGIELVAAMVIAVAIGYGLDRLFHTSPWLMIAFVPIGAIAGFRNLARALGPKA